MGYFMEEEEIWKCRKHSSKRKPIGVCHVCLRDRLIRLCPDCATERPCSCSPTASSSNSLSSSLNSAESVGETDRMSNLIDKEPKFQRSRSTAFPFLRSRFSEKDRERLPPPPHTRSSFWSVFKSGKKLQLEETISEESKMMRSKSVGVFSDSTRLKSRSWYFPSPIKVFRHSRTPKVVQERSPLCRG
ncbi:hypothetical protein GIB67_000477 [Kingdonia uniflora]|uniref:Uncharacterized protein n=1 Tax=Kingdonia uniflora TaxID=39325 RepID=A0A7J7L0E4_9MAGN|nr:hypothetical protein GIB67_000477 [Kingdonia uniflora]